MSWTVNQHFARSSPQMRELYDLVLEAVKEFGVVAEDPKKTSIHLSRKTAFAGVRIRRDHLLLTIKSDREIDDERVVKSEKTSTNRWHVEIKAQNRKDIDDQLTQWLKAA